MADYTTFTAFIFEQILGYQDVNEILGNIDNVRNAFAVEHQMDDLSATLGYGTHKDGSIGTNALANNSVSVNKLKLSTISDTLLVHHGVDTTVNISSDLVDGVEYLAGYSLLAVGSGVTITQVLAKLGQIIRNYPYHETPNTSSYTMNRQHILIGDFAFSTSDGSAGYLYSMINGVTASPPHKLGDGALWNRFLYLIRDKVTKEIIRVTLMEDPPWFNHRKSDGFEKDDPYLPMLRPHPYSTYTLKDSEEIVLVDLRQYDRLTDASPKETLLTKHINRKAEMINNGLTLEQYENTLANKIKEHKQEKLILAKEHSELQKALEVRNEFNKRLKIHGAGQTDYDKMIIEKGSNTINKRIENLTIQSGKLSLWDKLELESGNMIKEITLGSLKHLLTANEPLSKEEMESMPKGKFEEMVRIVKPSNKKEVKEDEKEIKVIDVIDGDAVNSK